MLNDEFLIENTTALKEAIATLHRVEETPLVNKLIDAAILPVTTMLRVQELAYKLVVAVRKERLGQGGLDAFLFQYDLSSEEGIALMCLAEALLRIPDTETVDRLIRDKISNADWESHMGKSHSLFVNAATWALMLTGKIIGPRGASSNYLSNIMKSLATRGGEPIIRQAIMQAMRILSRQFVMGRTIEEGIARARTQEAKGYRYSYDMLGEAAHTAEDADKYLRSYEKAIQAIAIANAGQGPIEGPGISVKLSALHPRYEVRQRVRVMRELLPRVKNLALMAKDANIGFTIDAEEASRLELSLEIIEALIIDPDLAGWDGLGLAVQAYQKRATAVIDWLISMARQHSRRLMIRLVKGAYWDAEVKDSQMYGLVYPVFTRKIATDVSYHVCMRRLLEARDAVYPQFATHNAHTLATVLELAGNKEGFEFQCLHGMGDALYNQIVGPEAMNIPCRIYAPVGTQEDLLAYLVRRLLENGANSSFVNRIVDEKLPIEEIVADPVAKLQRIPNKPHPCIPLAKDLYGTARQNSIGLDLSQPRVFLPILQEIQKALTTTFIAQPSVAAANLPEKLVYDPADKERAIGTLFEANEALVDTIIERADKAFFAWSHTDIEVRASCLEKMAVALEENRTKFMALLIREAGKTIPDAISEIREAIDFCYYYAQQARQVLSPKVLSGPTGEYNQLSLHGRGVVACISPWNFPLAIFLGQVTAALVAGNTVIAKPAEQTCLIAQQAVQLLYASGVPSEVIQLLPGSGKTVGNRLIHDVRVQAVVFTGSTEVAQHIQRVLAGRPGPLVPFIAETGGQNAMIVDSSALPEQVIQDVITSAFLSAGQRCSALRILCLQEDVADKMLKMLRGAMAELRLGDPMALSTDIGPVIGAGSLAILKAHYEKLSQSATLIAEVAMPQGLERGNFFAPCAFEIGNISDLEREVFGPILHIVRFSASELPALVARINATGYGLTLGMHSRIEENINTVIQHARVGNIYINRNMVGAVVGVQPFGGEGLSGTGPKAGGPHYLQRLSTERTLSINTTAAGGNASLMSLTE